MFLFQINLVLAHIPGLYYGRCDCVESPFFSTTWDTYMALSASGKLILKRPGVVLEVNSLATSNYVVTS